MTAENTMDSAHFHLHTHTHVQVARGRWEGGVPFSTALSPAELPWKQAMAGNNRRKKSWGLLHHLHELRFCHCLYMDIFKEYPGKLCTVGKLNGLCWKQSTETEHIIHSSGLQYKSVFKINVFFFF